MADNTPESVPLPKVDKVKVKAVLSALGWIALFAKLAEVAARHLVGWVSESADLILKKD